MQEVDAVDVEVAQSHLDLSAEICRDTGRMENGYCGYDAYLIDRAAQVRGLIDSGIPTKIISPILPCLDQQRAIVPEQIEPELLAILGQERDRITERIDFLTRNRDSIASYMEEAEDALAARHAKQVA